MGCFHAPTEAVTDRVRIIPLFGLGGRITRGSARRTLSLAAHPPRPRPRATEEPLMVWGAGCHPETPLTRPSLGLGLLSALAAAGSSRARGSPSSPAPAPSPTPRSPSQRTPRKERAGAGPRPLGAVPCPQSRSAPHPRRWLSSPPPRAAGACLEPRCLS